MNLSSAMRFGGVWKGEWSGLVNVFETSSLGLSSAQFILDYTPPLNPNLRSQTSSTLDSRGELVGEVNGETFDFGKLRVGTSETRSVSLRNSGPQESRLTGTIGGILDDPLGSFSIVNGKSFASLAGGESQTKDVSYVPEQFGSESTYLAINTGVDDFYLPLNGTGTGPFFSLSNGANTLNFGQVAAGEAKELSIELTNDLISLIDRSGELLELTGLTISSVEVLGNGFSVDAFSPVVLHDSTGFDVTKAISVSFAPQDATGISSGLLRVFTDQESVFGSSGRIFEIELSATAVPEPLSGSLFATGIALLAWRRVRCAVLPN
ncbi:MAG: choice-of-anchor D domain-containing protein [Lacipirellulaceae bacterium]